MLGAGHVDVVGWIVDPILLDRRFAKLRLVHTRLSSIQTAPHYLFVLDEVSRNP